MTRYTAFGLQIDSELPLPSLLPGSDGAADVRIRLGPVPTALPDPLGGDAHFQAARDAFLFNVTDIGRFYVVKGREIIIDPLPDCPEEGLRLYLLGSACGALLHQRGLLVMHASTIQTAHGAVLFVGHSGHGKSTLLGAMVQRGYAALADDVTAVRVESHSDPIAFSSFPRLRLCADAAARLGHSVAGLPRVHSRGWIPVDKYLVPVTHFCATPLPIHAIYTLSVHDEPEIHLEPVDPLKRFTIVTVNTYRYMFLEALELLRTHFLAAARLAKAVPVSRITRPASPFMIDELVDRLEMELGPPIGSTKVQEVS